jgi:hypothetical protein
MTGFTLTQLAAIAEIIGACTIVTGLIFGAYQIRAHRIQQRNAIATELTSTFYNAELARAVLLLQQLPDGASMDELRGRGPEFEDAAVIVCTSFETMGLLVYRKIAPFDLVMDLAGGMVASMFRKLEGWVNAKQLEQDQPSWAEWFVWLAQRAEKHKNSAKPDSGPVGNWRP